MEIVSAFMHVIGAVVACGILGIMYLYCIAKWNEIFLTAFNANMLIDLGLSEDTKIDKDVDAEVTKYISKHFRSDKLANRVADFIGVIMIIFNVLIGILSTAIIGIVIYLMFIGELKSAAGLWSVVALSAVGMLINIIMQYLCILFTDRIPGVPRKVRNGLIEIVASEQAEKFNKFDTFEDSVEDKKPVEIDRCIARC